ncbi:MAG: hypothetical protein WBG86_05400, partial [Polyangiales bacterium]
MQSKYEICDESTRQAPTTKMKRIAIVVLALTTACGGVGDDAGNDGSLVAESGSAELNGELLNALRCRIRRRLGLGDCPNTCPRIVSFYSEPLEDGTNKLRLFAIDVDGGPSTLTTTISASNGTVADANAKKTIFTCGAEGGPTTLTATANDADPACDVSASIEIDCPGGDNPCTGVDCDDGNVCTEDACDTATGQCGSTPVNGGVCELDGLPGLCAEGQCEDAMLCANVVCDDGNACTTDTCNPIDGGCESVAVCDGEPCDFNGAAGSCMGGVCRDANPCAGVTCDDENECTEDSCNPLTGACETSATDGAVGCDFGGLPGLCSGGVCQDAMLCAGVDCDDDNECTDEACNPLNGECDVSNVENGTSCDFGGLPGQCENGACADAALCQGVTCDDGNECTSDACDPTDGQCGTTNVTDGTGCDFGGLPGICNSGSCEDAMLCEGVNCNDGNPCTDDACDPIDGQCVNTNVADDTACDFGGNPGLCEAGVCMDAMLCTGVICDDGNACTTDACDPQSGQCSSSDVPDGTSCNGNGSCFEGNCVLPVD